MLCITETASRLAGKPSVHAHICPIRERDEREREKERERRGGRGEKTGLRDRQRE